MAEWRELARNREEWGSLQYNDPRLTAFAEEIEDKYGLPPGVLVAIKNAGERTPTVNGEWKRSPVGAQGLMQFMPATMRLQDGKFDHDPSNPFESIIAAGRLMQHTLKYQYKGDVSKALADYNGGPRAAEGLTTGRLNEETTNYLMRVRDYLTGEYKPRLSQRLQQRQQGREPTNE